MPRPKHVRVEANFRTEAQCSACAWSLAAARKDDQWMCQCKRKVCFLKHCVRRLPSPPRATRLRLLCARRWRCVAASRRAAWHASPPALTRLQWLWGSTIASPRCPICAASPSLPHSQIRHVDKHTVLAQCNFCGLVRDKLPCPSCFQSQPVASWWRDATLATPAATAAVVHAADQHSTASHAVVYVLGGYSGAGPQVQGYVARA